MTEGDRDHTVAFNQTTRQFHLTGRLKCVLPLIYYSLCAEISAFMLREALMCLKDQKMSMQLKNTRRLCSSKLNSRENSKSALILSEASAAAHCSHNMLLKFRQPSMQTQIRTVCIPT